MPRIGSNLSLEPSLEEDEFINETSDDFDECDYEAMYEDAQQERMEDLMRDIADKF